MVFDAMRQAAGAFVELSSYKQPYHNVLPKSLRTSPAFTCKERPTESCLQYLAAMIGPDRRMVAKLLHEGLMAMARNEIHHPPYAPHPLRLGYCSRNVRSIEVLIDRDAVTSGAAASGQPWQHYDLATAGAPTPSSNNAHTVWPAPVAISTSPEDSAKKPSCWKPRTTCSAWSLPFPSPTTSARPSTTDKPPRTPCSPASPMSPHHPGPLSAR